MREDNISLQVKEMAISEKKSILEKQLEISEAETMALKTQLQLANERIEDLQSILSLLHSLMELKMIWTSSYRTIARGCRSRRRRRSGLDRAFIWNILKVNVERWRREFTILL